ncbi:MAG: 16S rRNA (adenine(1518)-N(6)/adenine(1519)-N(6))-dimethyltransferase RsmA [Deltaproteobacteria bacterium]|nr:16S rRNA (adenine(1518)-N(6)/adenine(1519)-N(6))-dimethyltransferase RsmA [Deltaproteobacteria bacterium]
MGKKYGQHFLRSPQILNAIVAGAGLAPLEAVLEIGPGGGALTERLLEGGGYVHAVEIDPHWCAQLREGLGENPRFRLTEGDIRKLDLSPCGLFGAVAWGDDSGMAGRDGAAPYVVVANLPYYLTTELLFRLARHRGVFSRLVLMVQKEVALRMAAGPDGGKTYGSLSIAAQHAFQVEFLFGVPPGAFSPPPKVESAVVRLKPRPPAMDGPDEARFFDHVKRLFTKRRKVLLTTLKGMYPEVPAGGWAELETRLAKKRPEELTPEAHEEIFRLITGLAPPPG